MSKTWNFKIYGEGGEVAAKRDNLSEAEAVALIEDAMRGGTGQLRHGDAERSENEVAALAPREDLQLVA